MNKDIARVAITNVVKMILGGKSTDPKIRRLIERSSSIEAGSIEIYELGKAKGGAIWRSQPGVVTVPGERVHTGLAKLDFSTTEGTLVTFKDDKGESHCIAIF